MIKLKDSILSTSKQGAATAKTAGAGYSNHRNKSLQNLMVLSTKKETGGATDMTYSDNPYQVQQELMMMSSSKVTTT